MNAGNAMIGYTTQREAWQSNGFMKMQADGTYAAWWKDDNFKLAYPGPIPVADVHHHLLGWVTQECDIAVKLYLPTTQWDEAHDFDVDEDGNRTAGFKWIADTESKAIVRPDNEAIFGYFGRDSYEKHDYMPIIQQCQNIADGELGIASAFLMDHGAVFIIGMELPEEVTTTEGIAHRVRLQASTSQNGRFATRWDIVDEFAVCSNSFQLNINKADKRGNSYSVKHTSRSLGRVMEARQALGLVYKATEDFNLFLDAMTKVDITNQQFDAIVNGLVPMPEVKMNDKGEQSNKAAFTICDKKRDKLGTMYRTDNRCRWFNGTLFGAFQTWSTWNQWERPTGDNLEASIMGTLTGKFANTDEEFFALVAGMEDIATGPLVEASLAIAGSK
jgi:phage/plasmid-like protein (TIGR03299 family)